MSGSFSQIWPWQCLRYNSSVQPQCDPMVTSLLLVADLYGAQVNGLAYHTNYIFLVVVQLTVDVLYVIINL